MSIYPSNVQLLFDTIDNHSILYHIILYYNTIVTHFHPFFHFDTHNCNYRFHLYYHLYSYITITHYNYSKSQYNAFRKSHKCNIPSYTSYCNFAKIINKHSISKYIIDNFKIQYSDIIDTKIVSIDSTFIPNKNCRIDNELISMNSFYKNKYGVKVTAITNEYGLPQYVSLDNGASYDSKIAVNWLNKNDNINLSSKILLGDTGYDSKELINILKRKKWKYIIPENKRNKYTPEMKYERDNVMQSNGILRSNYASFLKNIRTVTKDAIVKKSIIAIEKEKLKDAIENNKNKLKIQINRIRKNIKKTNIKDIIKKHPDVYKKRSTVEHFNACLKCKVPMIANKNSNTIIYTIYRRMVTLYINYIKKRV